MTQIPLNPGQSGRAKKTLVSMSDDMRSRLADAAEANDVTMAALVRDAMDRYLDELDIEQQEVTTPP
jgi:predicted DNA-binding protein